jgi:competence protein ComFC
MGRFFCEGCQKKIEFFDIQVCPYCEKPSLNGLTHEGCRKKDGLDGMFVLAHYRGPIREAIRQIKYEGAFAIGKEIADMFREKYHHKFEFDYLVPVPLSAERERDRGFNQAEKLAGYLNQGSRNRNQETKVQNCLRRNRNTKPQFDLSSEERINNVENAFVLISNFKLKISNSSVCLVDDVCTTGATIFECAKVLKMAGAKKVYAICVARGG